MKLPVYILGALALIFNSQYVRADADLPDTPIVNQNLSLKDALVLAMANNLTLKQYQSDVDTASANARSASAKTKLNVATSTYGLLGDSNNIVASSAGVGPTNYFVTPSRSVLAQNVIAMIPLSTGGKLAGAVNSARAQNQATGFDLSETRLMVQETVTESYVKALLQLSLVDVAQSRLAAEDEQVRVTQEQVNTGRSAPVDLLREQAEDANAKQGVLEALNNEALALVDLKTVLGISQSSEITLADTMDSVSIPSGIPGTLGDCLRSAEANRPDLAAALKQVGAARANLQATHGEYAPQVYAVGMVGASSVGNGGDGRVGYTVGLRASLPIYDGGQRRADVDAAKSRLDRAIEDAQVVRQTVDQQAASAWLNLQTAAQQVDTAKIGVDAAQQAYDLATMRYNAGKSIDAERLDALAALTRARGDLATATATVIEARSNLLTSIGSTL